ncbi:Gfo/Idh/MocA family protein [Mycobacterium sp. 4D054]|uniref:Gfo/Idh/MocA family protein n=1 Tax=unclassified Mycobacterium TaxID=2642494 RepID=UPI0021B39062|nr:Gfo/Idh/MocA family oxidoreductase [Mycobacterium sp. SMC-8]UXA14066.1 Gfo/Idh/MocA family oxidoreductase [Mycobacterium sp. SMC-8]
MNRCRVGFVGAGGVATRHARHLAGFPDVEIVAVTDHDAAAAQTLAGATTARDLEALLDRSPHAVYVCVPPHAHGVIEEQALAAGTAMFVEKPLALDLPTAQRIADAARRSGVVTAVGHHWRYSPAVAQVRELLDGRAVRLVAGSWIDRVPPVSWWSRRALSGGQIIEQAVHVLDLIRLLCGEVVEVTAYANAAPPCVAEADVDAATVAILRFRSGAVGTVAAACCLKWKQLAGLDIHADDVSVTIHEDCVIARTAHGPVQRSLRPDDAKRAADRAFVDAVLGDRAARSRILVDYDEALQTHQLACAISTSALERRTVRLDD